MKRYRVFPHDFDTRSYSLSIKISEEWSEDIKKQHYEDRDRTIQSVLQEYGISEGGRKIQDFTDFGVIPFSIFAFHNKFFHQIRDAFVIGAYYPSLTAACALGERILNHLLLLLRDDHSKPEKYRKVYDKGTSQDWALLIGILETWNVLLPDVVESFRKLHKIRNQRAIHFDPDTDYNDRSLALEAIRLLKEIIRNQFSGFGPQPWFITGIPGEIYIRKEAESWPFVKRVYLPNCILVGPAHTVEFDANSFKLVIDDDYKYEPREITDEEFVTERLSRRSSAE